MSTPDTDPVHDFFTASDKVRRPVYERALEKAQEEQEAIVNVETKADWLRNEIEKLEGMLIDRGDDFKSDPFHPVHAYTVGRNSALTTIITRYKEELKVLGGE